MFKICFTFVLLLCFLLLFFVTRSFISCCDVRYDFCRKTMFWSSLPPVVCRRPHVLFTLFVFVCNTYCVVFLLLFCFSSSCLPYVASFTGLSILDCPSIFSNVYLLEISADPGTKLNQIGTSREHMINENPNIWRYDIVSPPLSATPLKGTPTYRAGRS